MTPIIGSFQFYKIDQFIYNSTSSIQNKSPQNSKRININCFLHILLLFFMIFLSNQNKFNDVSNFIFSDKDRMIQFLPFYYLQFLQKKVKEEIMGMCSMCLIDSQIQSQKRIRYLQKENEQKNHSQLTKIFKEEQKETIQKTAIMNQLDQTLQIQSNDHPDKPLNIVKQSIRNKSNLQKVKSQFSREQNKSLKIRKRISEDLINEELSRNILKFRQISNKQLLVLSSTPKKQIDHQNSSDYVEDSVLDEESYQILNCCIKTVKKEIQNQRPLSKKDQQLIHKSQNFIIPTNINEEVRFKNHSIYKGEWMNGMRHGIGSLIFTAHSRYQGEWKQDKINGKGLYVSQNGQVYDGQWKDNEVCGSGKYHYKDGSIYVGKWKNSMQQGMGIYSWVNGDRYAGLWSEGKKNGYGQLSFQDGSYYKGQFMNNQLHGQGQYYWYQKKSYEGQWIHNQMTGNGTITWQNGECYEGEFKNGKLDGKGKFFYQDGSCSQGQWKNGRKHGKVVEQDVNGDIKTVEYSLGKIIKGHRKQWQILNGQHLGWTESIVDGEFSHNDQ